MTEPQARAMLDFIRDNKWIIHKKINAESHFVEAMWRLLAADANNVPGGMRGSWKTFRSMWELLVAQARVLSSWKVNMHSIYEEILELHFSPPDPLPMFTRDDTLGRGGSIASTIPDVQIPEPIQQAIDVIVGQKFPANVDHIRIILNEQENNWSAEDGNLDDVHELDEEIEIIYEVITID